MNIKNNSVNTKIFSIFCLALSFMGATIPSASAESFSIGGTALNTNNQFQLKDGHPVMSTWPLSTTIDNDQQFDRLSGNLLKHRSTGKCLNAYQPAAGSIVNVYPCNTTDGDQKFSLVSVGSNINLIQRIGTNLCLDMPSRNSNLRISLQNCSNGNANQQFVSDASTSNPTPPNNVGQPNFGTTEYRNGNIFWNAGFAPASTNPPAPKLGSALGNCTWYANGRSRQLGRNKTNLDKMYDNAGLWGNQAITAGIATSSTPQVGAIAQWNVSNSTPYGHVAVVEQINSNGTVLISESSYDPTGGSWNFLYRTRTIASNSPTRYILP
jgi:surface antigen